MVWPFKIVVSSLWSHGTMFKLKGGQMQQGHGYKSLSSCSWMVSTREQHPGPRPRPTGSEDAGGGRTRASAQRQ